MQTPDGIWLRSLRVQPSDQTPDKFPFNIPIIQSLTEYVFDSQVTFLVGENGCGKSTLLEALAAAVGSITVGSAPAASDHSLTAVRALADRLQLVWTKRTRRGFFMRSEDFFGYARQMAAKYAELRDQLAAADREYENRSPAARNYARLPYQNEISALQRDYGAGLDARSHGESYLQLFQARFVSDGLYLLDEPEAPLSPLRQLTFLALMKNMLAERAQFIIATHSPIILAFPGATILDLNGETIRPVQYGELEHVQIMKSFLEDPERYLGPLLE
jgi:predicted ATPase